MPDLHNSYLFHLIEQEEEPLRGHNGNGSPGPSPGPSPGQGLVGIARLAAQGEFVRPGHNVQYFTLEARSLLNRCSAPRMPFKWTINPYRGCEFACKYCYARYTHEYMELRDGLDFERKIYIKQQAAWLLRRDLRKVKRGRADCDRHGDRSVSAGRAAASGYAGDSGGTGAARGIRDRHCHQVGSDSARPVMSWGAAGGAEPASM